MQLNVEDARIAATMKTTLSGALIAAVFAVGAVEAAVVFFFLDKKQKVGVFAILAVTAAIALIASSVLGAKGITEVYKAGYTASWPPDAGKAYFSGQAVTGIVGLILVIWCAFVGRAKRETPKEPPDYQALKASLLQLQKDVTTLQALEAQGPQDAVPRQNKKRKKR